MSGGGLLRRLSERFTQTADEAEAADVRRRSHSTGAHEIAALADRQVATVAGKVRSVTLRPQSTVPALVVDLDDGWADGGDATRERCRPLRDVLVVEQ